MTFPPILSIVRRTIFPRTYTLGLRPANTRTTPRPRRLRTRTSRAESIGLRWLLALATELRFGGSGVRTPQLRRRWRVSPLPKASETARTCSLASVKLVTDQRKERLSPLVTILRFHPSSLRCKLPPLPPPSPRAPQPQAQPPSKEVLTVGRGAPKGGIRLPAPRRRSLGAALRVQLRAKGPEAHAAYDTEQALSPSRTREKVHALCLRPPERSISGNIRPPHAFAPRSGGRRCAFGSLSVSRADVAAKRRKGEEPP